MDEEDGIHADRHRHIHADTHTKQNTTVVIRKGNFNTCNNMEGLKGIMLIESQMKKDKYCMILLYMQNIEKHTHKINKQTKQK